jgi:hypothetical protein
MSREEAERNQRDTIAQGADYNNDGAVTDTEYRRYKNPSWAGWQTPEVQAPAAPAPEVQAPVAPPPAAQQPVAPPPPVEQPNFQTPGGGYRAPYSTGYFRPMQGYSNNGYGQLRPNYTGGGYAPLPGNAPRDESGNPFVGNPNFEQNSYNYSDYGTTGYNPYNLGKFGPKAFNY